MLETRSQRKDAWKTIVLFLVLVFAFTAPFHYAIVNLYPSRIYVCAIMWCPALAAFVTLKLMGRTLASLPWQWAGWRSMSRAYAVPALYGVLTYALIWLFGLGTLVDAEGLLAWGQELGLYGIGTLSPTAITVIAVVLLGTVEVLRASSTTLGEEIGWRGFFIFELRNVLSFTGVLFLVGWFGRPGIGPYWCIIVIICF